MGICRVDTWLMSCRVLKRNVEYALFKSLVLECGRRGLEMIVGEYIPTEKNGMVENHFENLGFSIQEGEKNSHSLWRFNLTEKELLGKINARESSIEVHE